MLLQSVLLEICLLLAAVVAPRYGPPSARALAGAGACPAGLCAPVLFSREEYRYREWPRGGGQAAADAAGTAGELPPASGGTEAPPSAAHAPAPGCTAPLPLLSALQEVLEDLEGGKMALDRTGEKSDLVTASDLGDPQEQYFFSRTSGLAALAPGSQPAGVRPFWLAAGPRAPVGSGGQAQCVPQCQKGSRDGNDISKKAAEDAGESAADDAAAGSDRPRTALVDSGAARRSPSAFWVFRAALIYAKVVELRRCLEVAFSVTASLLRETPRTPTAGPEPAGQGRAAALLATLLNCVWLEPHAALLPRPPTELLRLLGGVELPGEGADAANEVLPQEADESAAARASDGAGGRLAARALLVLLLLLFHDPGAHPKAGARAVCDSSRGREDGQRVVPRAWRVGRDGEAAPLARAREVARALASLTDPLLDSSEDTPRALGAPAAAPINFAQLLKTILARLSQGVYPLLLYCLVHRNPSFQRYCLCRVDAEEVVLPILEVLYQAPGSAESLEESMPPASVTALTLVLLTFTGDRAFCEGASRMHVPHGRWSHGNSRLLNDITVSSLLVVVLLRLAHWNFSAGKDAFFNRAIAGVLQNLAFHGVEQLHWHAADRLLEVTRLLARSALQAPAPCEAEAAAATPPGGAEEETQGGLPVVGGGAGAPQSLAEQHRTRMVRELLRALLRLLSGCLRVPLAARNCSLVCALQSSCPPQLAALEGDPEFGAALSHVRSAVAWFNEQCPPQAGARRGGSGVATSSERGLGARGPPELLAAPGPGSHARHRMRGPPPEVWRAAGAVLPDHVCWSR
ncbi:unnamed protein product, partial [Prorocentrum cordatum]